MGTKVADLLSSEARRRGVVEAPESLVTAYALLDRIGNCDVMRVEWDGKSWALYECWAGTDRDTLLRGSFEACVAELSRRLP